MSMIADRVDFQQFKVQIPNNPRDIAMDLLSVFVCQQPPAAFGAKNNMKKIIRICMSHKRPSMPPAARAGKIYFAPFNPRPYGTWLQHFALRAFLTTGSASLYSLHPRLFLSRPLRGQSYINSYKGKLLEQSGPDST